MVRIDIQNGIAEVLRSKKRQFPQHVNRISSMDDPCLRRLYYRRHDWDKATPTPDSLQGIFETGNILEPVIERIVSEVGHASTPRWRIVGSQTPTNDALLKRYNISGSIDGFLQYEYENVWVTDGVVDIKTMSPNVYAQINAYEDLTRYPWTKGYRGQLMLYALAHNQEQCFLLLVNKANLFDMKFVEFGLDMEYLDGLLEKADAVNKSIEAGEPPAGVNDRDVCNRCPWLAFCSPPIDTGGTLEIVDNAELESILDRLEFLSPSAKEYKALEGERDAILTKGKDVMVGRYSVTWKKISVHNKAREANVSEQWRKKIERI